MGNAPRLGAASAGAAGVTRLLLHVHDLTVDFVEEAGAMRAVDHVSFDLATGETLGLVGDSGCGKSTIALALMRLLPEPGAGIAAGAVVLDGQIVTGLGRAGDAPSAGRSRWHGVPGRRHIAASADSRRAAVVEVLRQHLGLSASDARQRAMALFCEVVPIPEPAIERSRTRIILEGEPPTRPKRRAVAAFTLAVRSPRRSAGTKRRRADP